MADPFKLEASLAENELKPCPLCGCDLDHVTMAPGSDVKRHPWNDGACVLAGLEFNEGQTPAWNRRTPPSTAGWLPIDDTVRDGEDLLAWGVNVGMHVVYFDKERTDGHPWGLTEGDLFFHPDAFTHYTRPSPPAPSQEGEGQAGDRESDLAEAERHLKAFVEDSWSPGRWEAARSFLLKMEVKRQQVGR